MGLSASPLSGALVAPVGPDCMGGDRMAGVGWSQLQAYGSRMMKRSKLESAVCAEEGAAPRAPWFRVGGGGVLWMLAPTAE